MDFTSKIELQSFPDNMTLDTCSEGFVQCFLRVPRLLGCTAAAMLPRPCKQGKLSENILQVAAPPSTKTHRLIWHLVCNQHFCQSPRVSYYPGGKIQLDHSVCVQTSTLANPTLVSSHCDFILLTGWHYDLIPTSLGWDSISVNLGRIEFSANLHWDSIFVNLWWDSMTFFQAVQVCGNWITFQVHGYWIPPQFHRNWIPTLGLQ